MKTKLLKITTIFMFIALYSCSEETTYITPEDTEGRVNVYIEGDITNEEAEAQLKAEIGTLTENIYVQNTTQLTELNIKFQNNLTNLLLDKNSLLLKLTIKGSGTSHVNTFKILQNNKLEEVFIDKIKTVTNFEFVGFNKPQPEKLVCNGLETIYQRLWFSTHNNSNNSVSFPDLKTIGSNVSNIPQTSEYSNVTMFTGKCNIVNFPKLEEIYELQFSVADLSLNENSLLIDELTFPELKRIENFKAHPMYYIKTLNLPKLEYCKNFYIWAMGNDYFHPGIYNNPTINFPMLNYCENFKIGYTYSNVEKINGYLHQFLTVLPISDKNLDFETELNPTGQGLIDKQTLIDQGNTVNFD